MRTPSGELPRVLTGPAARQLGLTRSAVRNGIARRGWQPLVRGVVLTARDEPTRADWALVGLTAAGPRSALSGWDALRLLGPGVAPARPPTDDVLVLTRCGRNRRIGAVRVRVTRRPFAVRHTSVLDPTLPLVAVTSAARAVADTALFERWLGSVRVMVAAAVQQGLCSVDELTDELAGSPRNNSALLRRALGEIAEGARSAAEVAAAHYLRRADVPPFELNAPIMDGGRLVAIADVLWRELRAVLEIDSREFHFSAADWQATMRRHNRLVRMGYAVTHYPPSAVGPAWTLEVGSWLRARACELGVPYR
jgi:hypothetical protein